MADFELQGLISKLKADQKVLGLVQLMKPLDVMTVISANFEICEKDAKFITKNLLQHLSREGLANPSIEKNSAYPVPSMIRRDNEIEESENYINNLSSLSVNMDNDQFPHPPQQTVQNDWPFDDMTVAIMNPKNKKGKRPLMMGPFDPDMKNLPGTDGRGIHSKSSPHHRNNSTSSSGRSWDKQGVPGWSSSPPGKEFDLPDDMDDLNVMEPSPVGSPIPVFDGGRNPGRKMGFRRR